MKIVAVSDTHMLYELIKVPKGDVFIHAGDIDLYTVEDAFRFNKWLGTLPHKHKIVIGGNHDKWLATNSRSFISKILDNATYLENSGITINGIKFWGSPITPTFKNWYFMAKRGVEIRLYWEEIPMNTDVLITHGPPLGILDEAPPMYSSHHAGCGDLLNRVKIVKPTLHIFGHIHYSRGTKTEGKTKFINVSCSNEAYELYYKPYTNAQVR